MKSRKEVVALVRAKIRLLHFALNPVDSDCGTCSLKRPPPHQVHLCDRFWLLQTDWVARLEVPTTGTKEACVATKGT
jgi:hypothetical protein